MRSSDWLNCAFKLAAIAAFFTWLFGHGESEWLGLSVVPLLVVSCVFEMYAGFPREKPKEQ